MLLLTKFEMPTVIYDWFIDWLIGVKRRIGNILAI